MCSGQERPQFLGDPHWPDQQIDWPLKKRRSISFDSVPEEEEHPASDEADRPNFPMHEQEEDNARENERDPDPVKQLVPTRTMFVVILRHVVR